jgi:MraZ protein
MSEVLRLDAEGRVFFEARLRTTLGLGDEAVFVGQGHKFQIWEPQRFQTHLEQARERVRRLRAERDALAVPGASG